MKKKKILHPIDKEILRALIGTKVKVTPSQISKSIGVHPTTAKRRLLSLRKEHLVKCKLRGNRLYCKANTEAIGKKLKKRFS